jgi:hypothetical protein
MLVRKIISLVVALVASGAILGFSASAATAASTARFRTYAECHELDIYWEQHGFWAVCINEPCCEAGAAVFPWKLYVGERSREEL